MLKQDAGAAMLRLGQGGGQGPEHFLAGVEAAPCLRGQPPELRKPGGMGLWAAHIRTCVLGAWCTFLP